MNKFVVVDARKKNQNSRFINQHQNVIVIDIECDTDICILFCNDLLFRNDF